MPRYIYNKDRKIKIFQLLSTRDSNGYEIITKKYIHPINKCLNAYFKDLRSSEIAFNRQIEDDTEAMFVINRRNISKDMFIEYISRRTFGTTTYQITGIDSFDDTSYDMKVSVKKINPPAYNFEEGTEWQ